MDLDKLFTVTGTEGIDTPVLSCNRCGARTDWDRRALHLNFHLQLDALSAIVQLGES